MSVHRLNRVRVALAVAVFLGFGLLSIGYGRSSQEADQLYSDAASLFNSGKNEEAKEKLRSYLKKYPKTDRSAEIHYLLGIHEEDFVSAVFSLRNAVNAQKGSEWSKRAQVQLGFLYFLRENYLRAAQEFRVFLSDYPNDPWIPMAHYWIGVSSHRARSNLDAQQALEKAWELSQAGEEASQVAAALCAVLVENHQYLEAVKVGEGVLKSADSPVHGPVIRETLQVCYEKLGTSPSVIPLTPETPASVPEPVVEPVLDQPQAEGQAPYSIQVGAFTKKKWAQNVEKQLRSRGYDAYTLEGTLDGKNVHKVRVGRYQTQQEAERMAEQIMQRENFKTYVVRD